METLSQPLPCLWELAKVSGRRLSVSGADRGPHAGNPRGVVVATGFRQSLLADSSEGTRSLPLPVLTRLHTAHCTLLTVPKHEAHGQKSAGTGNVPNSPVVLWVELGAGAQLIEKHQRVRILTLRISFNPEPAVAHDVSFQFSHLDAANALPVGVVLRNRGQRSDVRDQKSEVVP